MAFWRPLLLSLAPVLLLSSAGVRCSDSVRRSLEKSFASFETVTVYKCSGRDRRSLRQATNENRMTLTVENKQRKWTLDLQRNSDVIAPQFVLRYFDANGQEVISRNVSRHHFHGEIRGLSNSMVALSISNGIRGIVDDGETLFHVYPAAGDNENRHMLFRHQDFRGFSAEMRCGNGDNIGDYGVPSLPDQGNRHHVNKRASYEYNVELAVVVDNEAFTQLKNISTATNYVTDIVNVVDAVYKRMNVGVRIALTAVEIWTKEDRITSSKNARTLLDRFVAYNKDLPADNTQLLSSVEFSGFTVGMAFTQTICAGDRSAGINQILSYDSPTIQAVVVAHEMGHSIGMNHDDGRTGCNCKDKNGCVMAANSLGGPRNYMFSDCSKRDFEKTISENLGSCLFNVPQDVFGGPICGNGFLEDGEECDCGNDEECAFDLCCNNSTCKLKHGAVCSDSDSACCHNCQLSPAGELCRASLNNCDYAEHCTGDSAECPPNCYKADGTKCTGATEGFCFNAACFTLTDQCRNLWGPDSTVAENVCYRAYKDYECKNKKDDGTKNPLCNPRNVFCGRLLCKTSSSKPIIGSILETTRITVGSVQCKTTKVSMGPDVPNPGIIQDGTKCGHDKICYSDECLNVTTVLKLLGTELTDEKTCDNQNNPIAGGNDAGLIAGIVLLVILVAIVIFAYCFPHVFFRCCPFLLPECLARKSHLRRTSASRTNTRINNDENVNNNKSVSVQVDPKTSGNGERISRIWPPSSTPGNGERTSHIWPPSSTRPPPPATKPEAVSRPNRSNHPQNVLGQSTKSQSKNKPMKPPPPVKSWR